MQPIKEENIALAAFIKKTTSEKFKIKDNKKIEVNNEKIKVIESKKQTELNLLATEFKALVKEKGLKK